MFSGTLITQRLFSAKTVVVALMACVMLPPGFAQESQKPSPPAAAPPAEESRLSTALFREGLKKRGLTDFLDLHLRQYPPSSPSAVMLMTREVKLAEFADASRPLDERRAALGEANRILEQLIAENTDDHRRLDWRMALAHSLLYEEAEPFSTSILYFGGSDADRRDLAPLTRRAVAAARALVRDVASAYEGIDKLSAQEFEKIENTGLIEQLDRVDPAATYLLLWALFYDSLPRADDDPARAQQLNEILEILASKPEFLQMPQERSHVQVPAMLLAGMTARRLNDLAAARQHFDRAAGAADRLTDASERDGVQWALALAAIESARAARDDARYDAALSEVIRLRALSAAKGRQNYGVRVAAALLERSILAARAAGADKAGRPNDARTDRENAWRALATLAAEEPDQRDALYATLYKLMDGAADSDRPRDPVDTCALLAGLLREASRDEQDASQRLDQAVAVAEKFLSAAGGAEKVVAPEVLYNLAIAQYRRGEHAIAARKMLEVAREFPNFGDAAQASEIAVQLAAQQYADSAGRTPEITSLYRESMEMLVNNHTNTEAARYWRFYLAQLLEELGDDDRAAAEYARVVPNHELFLESRFGQLRALARAAQKCSERRPRDAVELVRRADALNTAHRDFVALGGAGLERKPDPDRKSAIGRLLAEARIIQAETALLPGVDRPQAAIDTLVDFERLSPEAQSALAGRLWRARLQAMQALERLDEAAQAVPAYVAADSKNAGSTLQSLYLAMTGEVARLRESGDESGAQQRADIAIVLAQQLLQWSERPDAAVTPAQRRELAVQLAEAHLSAGKFAEARDLFEKQSPAADADVASLDGSAMRVVAGHAESLFGLGELAKALPEFNRLATGLPADQRLRWKSLHRDLECRTTLGDPPAGILRVIAQQRRLYPEMGGPDFAGVFDRIERENRRRLDATP